MYIAEFYIDQKTKNAPKGAFSLMDEIKLKTVIAGIESQR